MTGHLLHNIGLGNDHLIVPNGTGPLPCLPSRRHPGRVRHVHCHGSREHVLSWSSMIDRLGNTVCVTRCSCPECAVNAEADEVVSTLQDMKACIARKRLAMKAEAARVAPQPLMSNARHLAKDS